MKNYPQMPKTDQELIDYWLKVAGSGGKGCQSGSGWDITVQKLAKEYLMTGNIRVKGSHVTNIAESDTGVKGTSAQVVKRDESKEECNK